ncbi:TonB family protein [Echinicola soli]|uniref:TonB family protein n=1 Tax=Echinicola soli TaxID=2591634 RepID=A0A514CNX4_9BACT|nr:TonB family protein [Echinicola soli]
MLKYPKDCRRKGIEGNVHLSLKINAEGKLTRIDVMNPEDVDLSLQHEAVSVMSLYPWGFKPALDRSGSPVESPLNQPINFRFP